MLRDIVTVVLLILGAAVSLWFLFFALLGFAGSVADASYRVNFVFGLQCLGVAILVWLPAAVWIWWSKRHPPGLTTNGYTAGMQTAIALAGSALAAWLVFAGLYYPRNFPPWQGLCIGGVLLGAVKVTELAAKRRFPVWVVIALPILGTAGLYWVWQLLLMI